MGAASSRELKNRKRIGVTALGTAAVVVYILDWKLRRYDMRRLIRYSIFALSLGTVLVVFLISASVYTFHALTAETVIAEITFERTGEQRYLGFLKTGDHCTEQAFPIYGDQWRVDAQFLKWKYWALLLGLDSQYRLDRFEGRYSAIADQNVEPTLSHSLDSDTTLDVARLAEALGPVNFLTDASYGSSTYQDIDTASIHYVYRTTTGIITRSFPRSLPEAGEDGLAIEIDRACGGEPGLWKRVTAWTDSAVRAAL